MADTYTATLDNGQTTETVELELIAGEPQKSFTRASEVNGEEVELLWELDQDSPDYTYRPQFLANHDYN
ncbi:hypothetical protein [Desertivibrio insolitus]|uniref:hypothetical protein n=1 Tax=Herbiconiux sp. SYSU D00978 TaxID=2812562 RepID=UPI001A96AAC5|nr:hypothetical protein [Herbiconiux sp. SYSU D00978]